MRLKYLLSFLKKNFSFFLYYILPFNFYYLKYSNLDNFYFIYINKIKIVYFSIFLKFFYNLRISNLVDLVVVDNYKKKFRFKLIYNFLSLKTGLRIFLLYFLNEKKPLVNSINFFFKNSNWMEREAWDLYGIFFFQNFDLRRILTDYGFKGFPFRKDFPLTGYIELRFDDIKQDIIYEPIYLNQELRFFNFSTAWEKNY